jgi:beta-glucosidase-like glycosyl hydrolase
VVKGEVVLGSFPDATVSPEYAELLRSGRVGSAVLFRHNLTSCMTTHVCFTALDAVHPTALSEAGIEPLLRRELGYDDVVATEDMEMLAMMEPGLGGFINH